MVQGKALERILYISYDGLTDPLGQSQIIPYIQGLAKEGYMFTVLTFEKKERFNAMKENILRILEPYSIEWVPMSFTSKPPLVSKYYDLIRMKRKAFELQKKRSFSMVHCRSYIAADIGLKMKNEFGVKFFFDMRGFWADEKRDGGAWRDDHPVFKRVYKYYKKREAQYLQGADHIISLTNAAKNEMAKWPAYNDKIPVSVIPCCADMDHFSVTDSTQKSKARKDLNIPEQAFVMSYLGSVGAWYMLDEMLDLFSSIKSKYPTSVFLFITHSSVEFILDKLRSHKISPGDVKIIEATRDQVPLFLKASDINVSFIKPVYSKISSSPTKLGEVLSTGIPVIVNSGVGDVEAIVKQIDCGVVISDFNEQAYQQVINAIPGLIQKDPKAIRTSITPFFDLKNGVLLYSKAYKEVLSKTNRLPYNK